MKFNSIFDKETAAAVASIWAPRLVGVVASVVVGKAAEKGLTLDPAEVAGVMLGTYAYLHRAISKKINPGDAAKSKLVNEDKAKMAFPGQDDYIRGSEL